jgi:hypothetical protein
MGALDGIIQLLLFVCFGVYVAMGIGLIGMGAWYMSDVGALGATAMWLLLFGFLMLIIGGVAIFANLKQMWLVLFVVELINVVLFLVRIMIPPPLFFLCPPFVCVVRHACRGWLTARDVLTCAEPLHRDRCRDHDGVGFFRPDPQG